MRRHLNLLQVSSNNSVSSEASTSPTANHNNQLNSISHAENTLMIPLRASDLDTLRANGFQFSSAANNSGISNQSISSLASSDSSLNLTNVIISSSTGCEDADAIRDAGHHVIIEAATLADHHQQHLQHSQQHLLGMGRSGARLTHHPSNDVSSNGIVDSQNLGSSFVGSSIINLNGNDNCGLASSASGLIQALGAAVASGNFPSLLQQSLNIPLAVNQNNILGASDIMTLNSLPANLISETNRQLIASQQQQLQNQQQLHSQQQQQLFINQNSGLSSGSGMINNTQTINHRHRGMTSSNAVNSRISESESLITSTHRQGNSSGLTVTLGAQQQMWVPPDQSGFLPAAVSLAGQESLPLLEVNSSCHDRVSSLQELQQAEIDGNHLQGVRPQLTGIFQMHPQGARIVSYQVPAHSTLEDDSSAHEYQDMASQNEATSTFNSMHQISEESQAALNAAAQMIATPAVDSSSLSQSYQIVYDAENRVLTVQRVMSPSDCTVSQSTLSMDGAGAQSTQLLPMSGQAYTMVQVSSLPSAFAAQSSNTGEVSTSSMEAMLDACSRASGSSLHSFSHGHTSNSTGHGLLSLPKIQKQEIEDVTECDTTQVDIDFHHHHHRDSPYLGSSNNIEDEQSLDSTSLHSNMPESGVVTSAEVNMDSTLDSSNLTALHPVSMEASDVVSSQHSTAHLASSSGQFCDSAPMAGPSGFRVQKRGRPSGTKLARSPATITTTTASRFLRKSKRLEQVDQELKASQRKRNYQTQLYNPDMLWCEDCMQVYEPSCPIHKLSAIVDKVVLSRAWASAPNVLQIFRFVEAQLEPGDSIIGVQAKRQIPKFTQFGPFEGELVDSLEHVQRKIFPLKLEYPDGSEKYFETSDENKCNWMMFVRPAKTFTEQNLVAFQYKQDIYFHVTRVIECRQELKVWYAAHYGERLSMKPLTMTDQDLQALDEEDAKFGCFECSRKFKTSAALQQHLSTHDSEDIKDFEDALGDEDFHSGSNSRMNEDKPKGASLKAKVTQGRRRNVVGEPGKIQWKKSSSNIYINKTLKKYKKRQCSDKVLQSMKGMYRRQGKVSGGNEWMCTHCGLTFDNSSLLNLHTLTHAAEDLDMDEIRKWAGDPSGENASQDIHLSCGNNGELMDSDLAAVIDLNSPMVACPKCNIVFNDHKRLMSHVTSHGQRLVRKKPLECDRCNRSFGSEEKLMRHSLVHGPESDKPLECGVCMKRVMNNSAMACHMKTHSDRKYYDCPVCGDDFDNVALLKEHSIKHMDDVGNFPCVGCCKTFDDFSILKKHMKTFHSDRIFECPECSKPFPRLDKLRLHMLRHTTHREFMCETCGRQFKRKDKLKEHTKRMHSKERIELNTRHLAGFKQVGKFTPKVMPSDYHRFIYKCHTCLLGFKRRGMLVNHLAKRHPDIKPDQVPELNLPILKTQKDFYCQYCDKIYKSSSKRKAHISKNHPGCDIPPSTRKRMLTTEGTRPSSSFSHTVSSITTMPHGCKFCHKQYASKAKLLQHQRKTHTDLVEPAQGKRKMKRLQQQQQDFLITVTDGLTERYEAVPITVVSQADSIPGADLLTQAMSELHGYSTSEFTISPRLTQAGTATMLLQPTTIDISQLNLHSFTATPNMGVTTVIAQPPQTSSPTQPISVMTGPNGTQTINLASLTNAQFITRAWAGGFTSAFK